MPLAGKYALVAKFKPIALGKISHKAERCNIKYVYNFAIVV